MPRRLVVVAGARSAGALLVALCYGALPAQAQQPVFQGLRDLPGGAVNSYLSGMSTDGRVLVGRSGVLRENGANDVAAFRWTAVDSMQNLGGVPNSKGVIGSDALAVSADGLVAVGYANTDDGGEATLWMLDEEGVTLGAAHIVRGFIYSSAAGVSADGSVVVGTTNVDDPDDSAAHEGFRWTADEGLQPLGDLAGGIRRGRAVAVSDSGDVIVGYGSAETGQKGGALGAGRCPRTAGRFTGWCSREPGIRRFREWTLHRWQQRFRSPGGIHLVR